MGGYYVAWLNCHYDIDLISSVKEAPSLPIDVCKDTTLTYD